MISCCCSVLGGGAGCSGWGCVVVLFWMGFGLFMWVDVFYFRFVFRGGVLCL